MCVCVCVACCDDFVVGDSGLEATVTFELPPLLPLRLFDVRGATDKGLFMHLMREETKTNRVAFHEETESLSRGSLSARVKLLQNTFLQTFFPLIGEKSPSKHVLEITGIMFRCLSNPRRQTDTGRQRGGGSKGGSRAFSFLVSGCMYVCQ